MHKKIEEYHLTPYHSYQKEVVILKVIIIFCDKLKKEKDDYR